MPLGEYKPLLAALVLPPAGPLLLAGLGLALAPVRRRLGGGLVLLGVGSLWLLSCHAVALALTGGLLPPVAPVRPEQLRSAGAIVVLGGGVRPAAAEFGGHAQPSAHTLARLRYAAHLARQSGLPLAFAGGVGWSNAGTATAAEATVAARVLQQDYGLPLRWADAHSRDTAENALRMAQLLHPAGVRRVALVTDAWHLPRAAQAFRAAGFEVVGAAMGFDARRERGLLEWLPSAHGLTVSRRVLREWLALRLAG